MQRLSSGGEMSEMVERIAQAISAAELEWKEANGGDDASVVDCPDEVKAYAALEAMREPTEEMVNRGVYRYSNGDPNDSPAPWGIRDAWCAMIDAALNEGFPSPLRPAGSADLYG